MGEWLATGDRERGAVRAQKRATRSSPPPHPTPHTTKKKGLPWGCPQKQVETPATNQRKKGGNLVYHPLPISRMVPTEAHPYPPHNKRRKEQQHRPLHAPRSVSLFPPTQSLPVPPAGARREWARVPGGSVGGVRAGPHPKTGPLRAEEGAGRGTDITNATQGEHEEGGGHTPPRPLQKKKAPSRCGLPCAVKRRPCQASTGYRLAVHVGGYGGSPSTNWRLNSTREVTPDFPLREG